MLYIQNNSYFKLSIPMVHNTHNEPIKFYNAPNNCALIKLYYKKINPYLLKAVNKKVFHWCSL